jgi:hypothetical protein
MRQQAPFAKPLVDDADRNLEYPRRRENDLNSRVRPPLISVALIVSSGMFSKAVAASLFAIAWGSTARQTPRCCTRSRLCKAAIPRNISSILLPIIAAKIGNSASSPAVASP